MKVTIIKILMMSLAFSISAKAANSTRWVTEDFFIQTLSTEEKASFVFEEDVSDCRKHIEEIMCLHDGEVDDDELNCKENSRDYAIYFQELYDQYPPSFQKMFCSLNIIEVLTHFYGTAFAGLIKDENGEVLGARMGIRQSVLDQKLTLQHWTTWKEQLSFGGVNDQNYTISPNLPQIHTQGPNDLNDFLYFVVAHEFGHIFDFANQLNRMADDCDMDKFFNDPNYDCKYHPESWGEISWSTFEKVKPQNEFPNQQGLCFYWCDGSPLNPNTIPQVYHDLYYQSDFISIYATTQAWDDFAESLAYYVTDLLLGSPYVLNTQQGQTYNMMQKLKTPLFSRKIQYIENFLNSDSIHYP